MDNFTFYAPTYFDFGKGAEKHVADLIKNLADIKCCFTMEEAPSKRADFMIL